MNPHKALIIKALDSYRGDNLARARYFWKDLTQEEMEQQHGHSGLTKRQLLESYEIFDKEVADAIKWISEQS